MEKKHKDHRLVYFLECIQEIDIVLPILNLITPDGTLFLKEYHINHGHARGLRVACTLKFDLLQKVFIDNCGLTETETEELIAGFCQLDIVSSLVLRRTAIGVGSLPYLTSMAEKIFPSNLLVLKIERCQIGKEMTLGLCQMLNKRCYIRTLALVRVAFDAESIAVFCEYLSKKPYVEDLDLSDNRLDPKVFRPILKALSKLQSLKQLNISWNILLTNARGPQIGTYVKEEKIIYGRAD